MMVTTPEAVTTSSSPTGNMEQQQQSSSNIYERKMITATIKQAKVGTRSAIIIISRNRNWNNNSCHQQQNLKERWQTMTSSRRSRAGFSGKLKQGQTTRL